MSVALPSLLCLPLCVCCNTAFVCLSLFIGCCLYLFLCVARNVLLSPPLCVSVPLFYMLQFRCLLLYLCVLLYLYFDCCYKFVSCYSFVLSVVIRFLCVFFSVAIPLLQYLCQSVVDLLCSVFCYIFPIAHIRPIFLNLLKKPKCLVKSMLVQISSLYYQLATDQFLARIFITYMECLIRQ